MQFFLHLTRLFGTLLGIFDASFLCIFDLHTIFFQIFFAQVSPFHWHDIIWLVSKQHFCDSPVSHSITVKIPPSTCANSSECFLA
ncbi:hypothetical protein K469DRAFT_199027 [Zopfia rhizophila CBS 207.26]|uniref:Uncharacterized protein n=1 Tax=Zopfia rhizophila CBS 207.26 TaxID=1314779 RepID=A0A6A6E1S4_9PEZI|nr:hypothetical protein K469DRAFT_199027 [Zopfia rhizophila CBS 207.26]